jgi:hypothetical protein
LKMNHLATLAPSTSMIWWLQQVVCMYFRWNGWKVSVQIVVGKKCGLMWYRQKSVTVNVDGCHANQLISIENVHLKMKLDRILYDWLPLIAGLPDFIWCNLPKWGKWLKQMTTKYIELP